MNRDKKQKKVLTKPPKTDNKPKKAPVSGGGKGKKGLVTAVIVLAVVVALAGGGLAVLSRQNNKTVNVYEIKDQFAMTEYWGDGSQTDGMVSVEGIQPVYVSDTMNVKDVAVEEGQKVEKGDLLLHYDTTLTELDVQLKEVKVRQAELELTNAQKELAKVKTYKAGELIPGSAVDTTLPGIDPEGETEVDDSFQDDGTLVLLDGKGTYKEPFTYLWKNTYFFDDAFMYQAMRGSKDCYVRFLMVGQGQGSQHTHVPDHKEWYSDESGHYRLCGICGEEYERTKHSFLTVVDVFPDIDRQGSQHQVCGVCGYIGKTSTIPAIPKPETPTQAPTEPPTEPPTEEPSTEPPTSEPPSEEEPTTPPSEDEQPTGQENSSPAPTKVQAEMLMQFQSGSAGRTFQVISIHIPSTDEAVKTPIFDWKDSKPLPAQPAEEPTEQPLPGADEPVSTGIRYTAEELRQMVTEAEAKVRDLDLELRRTKLDYDKAQKELNNSAIYAEMDGTVKDVMDPVQAKDEGSAILNITAGGGYYIHCTLSELERDSVEIGQKVTVTSWSSDEQFEGEVTEISDYPSTGSNWGAGNSNVSYYPFTVFVSEEAGLREGDYVGVQYGAAKDEKGFYLQSVFIRTENGRSYVYADNNGTLEKRYISTGRSLWGSYTQVFSGITPETNLAFPYGSNVREGAATVLASADQLYGYY